MPISEVYNMDCMDYMAQFPDNHFDLAIVDPPYANTTDAVNKVDCVSPNKQATTRTRYKKVQWNTLPTQSYFMELKRISKHQIIWGANFFGLAGGFICWNKNGTAFGECELAYCSLIHSVRLFEFTWNGMIQGDMKNKEHRIHPTQKPVALYKWLLQNYAKPGDTILDTHLGSQSSRIAAWDLGFDFTGYELDPDYFREGNERFERHRAQGNLFTPDDAPKPTQGGLFG